MSTVTADGSRLGEPRTELESLVAGVGFEPERVGPGGAGRPLARDGAVILTGYGPEANSLVRAVADVLGTRLREVFPVRVRGGDREGPVPLHEDSYNVVADVGGRPDRFHHPDQDYVVIQCVEASQAGGASLVADGYRLADRLRDQQPELWEFLTGADVDYYGSWERGWGVPAAPQLCRHVEYTRTGRRIIRINQGAQPLPREPRKDHHEQMLDLYADVAVTVAACAPRVALAAGEILFLDNYRCWHGRDGHDSPRLARIMTARSTESL